MAINTRLTEAFKLTHPVVLAPMGVAAVAAAGGLDSSAWGIGAKTGSSLKPTPPAMFVLARVSLLGGFSCRLSYLMSRWSGGHPQSAFRLGTPCHSLRRSMRPMSR
jgi:hypothetical protein